MPEGEEQTDFDEIADLLRRPGWTFNVSVSPDWKLSLAPEGEEPVDVDFMSVRIVDYDRHAVNFLAKELSPEVTAEIHELIGMAAYGHLPTVTDRVAEILARINPRNYTDALETIIKLLIAHGSEARELLEAFLTAVMRWPQA